LALIAIALHVPGKLEWNSKDLRFTNSPDESVREAGISQKARN
jgi:hypothetical protein